MSWKTLCRLPQLSSSKERLADVQATLRAYVNEHFHIELEGREHPQATYDRLFRELQHKYPFIPDEQRDLIRLLAMKEHASNRCKARRLKKSRSRESTASKKRSLVPAAAAPPPRLQPTTADKVFAVLQDRPGLKAALVKLRAYSRLRVDLNRLMEDARKESFERLQMFVSDVSKISLPHLTPWEQFATAVIIYEA